MSVPSRASETTVEWLGRLKANLGPVQETLEALPEALRSAALQIVLPEVIRDIRGPTAFTQAPERTVKAFATSVVSGPARFTKFLEDYGITAEILANVVDLDSGHILVRTLADTRAESTRRIAALLSLINASKTGEFAIDRDALVKACEDHSVYDRSNFTGHMSFEYNGAVVFIREENRYRVSRPGEAYVAYVVKGSRSTSDTTPSSGTTSSTSGVAA